MNRQGAHMFAKERKHLIGEGKETVLSLRCIRIF